MKQMIEEGYESCRIYEYDNSYHGKPIININTKNIIYDRMIKNTSDFLDLSNHKLSFSVKFTIISDCGSVIPISFIYVADQNEYGNAFKMCSTVPNATDYFSTLVVISPIVKYNTKNRILNYYILATNAKIDKDNDVFARIFLSEKEVFIINATFFQICNFNKIALDKFTTCTFNIGRSKDTCIFFKIEYAMCIDIKGIYNSFSEQIICADIKNDGILKSCKSIIRIFIKIKSKEFRKRINHTRLKHIYKSKADLYYLENSSGDDITRLLISDDIIPVYFNLNSGRTFHKDEAIVIDMDTRLVKIIVFDSINFSGFEMLMSAIYNAI